MQMNDSITKMNNSLTKAFENVNRLSDIFADNTNPLTKLAESYSTNIVDNLNNLSKGAMADFEKLEKLTGNKICPYGE